MLLARTCEQLISLRAFRPLLGSHAVHAIGLQCASYSGEAMHEEAGAHTAEEPTAALPAAGSSSGADIPPGDISHLIDMHELDDDVPLDQQRLLQVGVVGVPNAGKSTLVNTLTNFKVSAVSPKTNTTEHSRLGAFTVGDAQVALYDTPGVVDKQHYKNPAHQRRVRSAWTVASDCDLLLFLVDAARELARPDPRIHRLLRDSSSGAALGLSPAWQPPPAVLVLNKVDSMQRAQRPLLLPLADRLSELRQFDEVFFISAKDGRGVDELKEYLLGLAKPGAWLLDSSMATDRPEEEQALEVVREQLFLRLYKELPYQTRLRLATCLPLPDGSTRIHIEVLVQQESQKKIVVGSGGKVVSGLAQAAGRELSSMWGHPVHLSLSVKVESPA